MLGGAEIVVIGYSLQSEKIGKMSIFFNIYLYFSSIFINMFQYLTIFFNIYLSLSIYIYLYRGNIVWKFSLFWDRGRAEVVIIY